MRSPRKLSVTGIYHVMTRGVNKQDIFWDDEDRKKFLSELKSTKEKYKYELYAYCLMPNHVHLIIKDKEEKTISKIMQSLSIRYSKYINNKYDRVGHLFQGRYNSKAVNTIGYLIRLQRYIHQNPEKAGIEKTERYRWSSYQDYLSNKGITDTKPVLEFFSEDRYMALEEFCQYNRENKLEKEELEYEFRKHYNDEELIEMIKNKLNIENIYDIQKYNIKIRKNIIKEIKKIRGTTNVQISRVLGIERKIIERT